MKLKDACSLLEKYDKSRQHIKKQRHYFTDKVISSQSYGFSSSHVWMWELDHKESWVPKNWCFWTGWRRPLKTPGLQGDQISQSYRKSILNIHWRDWCWNWSTNTLATWCEEWLIRKDLDAEKDWRQEEKQTTEDEVVGWHYWLNGHEFEQAPGDGEGQGSLVCCSPWGCKESEFTEQLNHSK